VSVKRSRGSERTNEVGMDFYTQKPERIDILITEFKGCGFINVPVCVWRVSVCVFVCSSVQRKTHFSIIMNYELLCVQTSK
jgi:hypothetical protein